MSRRPAFVTVFPGYIGAPDGHAAPLGDDPAFWHTLVVGGSGADGTHPLEDLMSAAALRDNACTIHARQAPLHVKLARLERTAQAGRQGTLLAPLSLRGEIDALQTTRPWLRAAYLDLDLILTDGRTEEVLAAITAYYRQGGYTGPVDAEHAQPRDQVRPLMTEVLCRPDETALIDLSSTDHVEVAFDPADPAGVSVTLLCVKTILEDFASIQENLHWRDQQSQQDPDVPGLTPGDIWPLTRLIAVHSDLTDWVSAPLPWVQPHGMSSALQQVLAGLRTRDWDSPAGHVLYVPSLAAAQAALDDETYRQTLRSCFTHVLSPAHLPDEDLRPAAAVRVARRFGPAAPFTAPAGRPDGGLHLLSTPPRRALPRLMHHIRRALRVPEATFDAAVTRELQALRHMPQDVFVTVTWAGAYLSVIPALHAQTMTRPPAQGEPLDRNAPPLPNPARQFRAGRV